LSVDAEQLGVVALGVTSLLVIGPAIFKAANLRGDTSNKWSTRVDIAVVALDEKIVSELSELRDEAEDVLAPVNAPFDPAQAIVDPSPLSERVGRTAKYYAARVRMKNDLVRVRRLGRVFVMSLSMLALAIVPLTLYYADLVRWDPSWWAGVILGALGLVGLIVATFIYIVCVDRLSGAEILADTASQAGGGKG
jgi:hypothetical protein